MSCEQPSAALPRPSGSQRRGNAPRAVHTLDAIGYLRQVHARTSYGLVTSVRPRVSSAQPLGG